MAILRRRGHTPRWVLALLILIFGTHTFLAPLVWGQAPTTDSSIDANSPQEVTISIKSREFLPNTITLPLGQTTRLILKNLDAELHAFLPIGLMTRTHLNITGNGAPQFAKEGLVRVLLPTRGQTEILFTPSRPGSYPFLCDLPGHVMRGMIVVQGNNSVVE